MKITYVGRHEGGIHLPGDQPVAHGETVEVDDELGVDLCAREIDGVAQWQPAKKKPPTIAAVPAVPAEET